MGSTDGITIDQSVPGKKIPGPPSLPQVFKNSEEFWSVPGYQPALHCTHDQLDPDVVGVYEFSESHQLQCGLNGCGRWHWHGFVIRTKDGRATHCGQYCGRNEFGVSWDEMIERSQRAQSRLMLRETLTNLLRTRDARIAAANGLLDQLSTWRTHIERIMAEVNGHNSLARALDDCLRNGGKVQIASKVDRDQLSAMGMKSGNRDLVTIATIDGARAVLARTSVEHQMKHFVLAGLDGLSEESLAELDQRALAKRSKEIDSFQVVFVDAENYIKSARGFCRSTNLQRFEKLKELLPDREKNRILDDRLKRIVSLAIHD